METDQFYGSTCPHLFVALLILASRASWGWSILISMVQLQPLVLASDSFMLTLISFNVRICGMLGSISTVLLHHSIAFFYFCLSWFVGRQSTLFPPLYLMFPSFVYIEPCLLKVNSASSAALSFCSQLVLSSHCPFQELLHSSFEIIFKVGLTNLGVLLVSISPLPTLFLVSLDQLYKIIQTITLSRWICPILFPRHLSRNNE